MNAPRPTLHMLCGKVAAGKSTFAANLAAAKNTVLIVEDEWLAALFAEELKTPKDYLRCTRKLRRAMAPHLKALLNAGMSVVLDFQANTVESRTWMRNRLCLESGGNSLAAFSEHVDLGLIRPRGQV